MSQAERAAKDLAKRAGLPGAVVARKRWSVPLLVLAFLLTTPVALGVVVLGTWQIPTRVKLALTVDSLQFKVGKAAVQKRVLDSIGFESVSVEKFDRILIGPHKLEFANPDLYDDATDSYPPKAWDPVRFPDGALLSLTGHDDESEPFVTIDRVRSGSEAAERTETVRVRPGSTLTLELKRDKQEGISLSFMSDPAGPGARWAVPSEGEVLGTMAPITASEGVVVSLDIRGERKKTVALGLSGQASHVFLSVDRPFQLIADDAAFDGVSGLEQRAGAGSLTYRAELGAESPPLEIRSQPDDLLVTVSLGAERATSLFSEADFPVAEVTFTKRDESGNPVSAVISEGTMTYAEYPDTPQVQVEPGDFLHAVPQDAFHVEDISVAPDGRGMRVRLEGVANELRTESAGLVVDHRITVLNTLWQNKLYHTVFAVITWWTVVLFGAYEKLWKGRV